MHVNENKKNFEHGVVTLQGFVVEAVKCNMHKSNHKPMLKSYSKRIFCHIVNFNQMNEYGRLKKQYIKVVPWIDW